MGTSFERSVDVRWRDTDALGHVNHAVFLSYLEEGRDAFFAHTLGTDPMYVVARVEVDFRAEVHHSSGRVRVTIEVESIGTRSLTTRERVLTAGGDDAAVARVVIVRWDADAHKPVPFTAEERRKLAVGPP